MGAKKSKPELIQTEQTFFAVGETKESAARGLRTIIRNEMGCGKLKMNRCTKEQSMYMYKMRYPIYFNKVPKSDLIKASVTIQVKKEWNMK